MEGPVRTPVQNADLFEIARTRAQAGDDAGAIDDLTKLLEAQLDNVGALSLRGSLHLKRDEYALTIADLKRAVLLAPDSPVRRMTLLGCSQPARSMNIETANAP